MAKVVLTAEVEDGNEWEQRFRTHDDLFREYGVSGNVSFAVTSSNEVAIHIDVDDLDHYFKMMDSDSTAEAMKMDGVKRETVKTYILDKTMEL